MRNRIVNEYGNIDLSVVFDTVTNDIPELLDTLEATFGKAGKRAQWLFDRSADVNIRILSGTIRYLVPDEEELILYFTGTGNNRHVAEVLSKKLPESIYCINDGMKGTDG